MAFLQKQWLQIKAQLSDLSLSTKFLIGSVAVILVMVAAILIAYVNDDARVPISAFADGRGDEVLTVLTANGVDAKLEAGGVTVPLDQRDQAIAALAAGNLISADTAAAFAELAQNQSFFANDKQADQQLLIAKQQVLSNILRQMSGVKDAQVVIDYPRRRGFGASHMEPSASVNVTLKGGQAISKQQVRAFAGLVSGAVAELKPQRVQVIDGSTGKLHTVADPDDIAAGDLEDAVRRKEAYHQHKIRSLLANVRGVIVSVQVQTDNIGRKNITSVRYDESQSVLQTDTVEENDTEYANGGEAGVRSNNGLDIAGGGGARRVHSKTSNSEILAAKPVVEKSQQLLVGHSIKQINVSIVVPRSYFVSVFMASNPESDPPADDALQPLVDTELMKIEDLVRTQVDAEREPKITTSMAYDADFLVPATSGPSGIMAVLTGDNGGPTGWVTASALGLVALGFMFYMVRKSTRVEALPSVEELAGLPPSLPADDDLIGEVEEVDTGMQGVELDENELRSRKMADQISEMIKENPEEAATLLNRWVDPEQ